MLAIPGIDIECTFAGIIFQVGLNRLLVPVHHIVIMPAQHVDMGRHMHKMPGVRYQRAQHITRLQRGLGRRRHFHQVNVKMQQTRVGHGPVNRVQGEFQNLLRLKRGGPFGGGACL